MVTYSAARSVEQSTESNVGDDPSDFDAVSIGRRSALTHDEVRRFAQQAIDSFAMLRWRLGGVVAITTIALLIFWVSNQSPAVPTPADVDAARNASSASVPPTTSAPTTSAPPDIAVDVEGAVQRPGLYLVAAGSRVADALARAGGLSDAADSTSVNLAARMQDGQRLYVTRKGEAAPATVAPSPSSQSSSGDVPRAAVNINSASEAELDALPGIGPATAQAIVAYRQTHGPFRKTEDLAAVKGIGPAKLGQLQGYIAVS